MICVTAMVGLVSLLVFGAPSAIFAFGVLITPDSEYAVVVRSVNCSTTPQRKAAPIDRWGGPDPDFSYTYKFQADGKASYTFTGRCQAYRNDGTYSNIRYYVDASWDPPQKVAFEVGRVYDLGNVAPDKFQPGPNNYTAFALRLSCPADPWLNDRVCSAQTTATNHLEELFPAVKTGPFPLTRGALIYAVQVRLRGEYERTTMARLRQQSVNISKFSFPSILAPTAGQRFFAQGVVPIKLAPPQGLNVTSYTVAFQKKDANGNWVNFTSFPIPVAQAQSPGGFAGFGAGGTGATKYPQLLTSPGAWRLAAQVAAPTPSAWSNPVEFIVTAPPPLAVKGVQKGFLK